MLNIFIYHLCRVQYHYSMNLSFYQILSFFHSIIFKINMLRIWNIWFMNLLLFCLILLLNTSHFTYTLFFFSRFSVKFILTHFIHIFFQISFIYSYLKIINISFLLLLYCMLSIRTGRDLVILLFFIYNRGL